MYATIGLLQHRLSKIHMLLMLFLSNVNIKGSYFCLVIVTAIPELLV